MAKLETNNRIGEYTVLSLLKANRYTETYRVADNDGHSFFLKLFIVNRMPRQLVNRETHHVREIDFCRQMKHRNITSFVSEGAFEDEEGSYQYYVTDYFQGPLLSDYLCTNGPMPADKALALFRSLMEGVRYLHQQAPALCHNDITPSNIVLSDTLSGEAVLIDLGHTANPCAGIVPFDTSDLDVLYHAKETMVNIFDEAGDIFSACAVFYFMLTGKAPWEITVDNATDYKERFKALWQFRQKNPLDIKSVTKSRNARIILEQGLQLKAADRITLAQLFEVLDSTDEEVDDTKQETEEPSGKRPEPPKKDEGGSSDSSGANGGDDDLDIDIRRGGGNGFADIAGMQELKDYLSQKVIFVIQNKELAQQYRITPPNGMLLYGPPGCGKTFFAEKFAEETGFNFMLVKSSDIGSSLVHGTEAKIKKLFEKASKNSPIVLCFDEFDALVPNRGAHGSEYVASEVNEFLAQMNNCSKKGIFIIATSNRPDKIDPAVLRTGRIDKQVFVPLPDFAARVEMFKMYLDKRPTCDDVNIEKYAKDTEGYIASDIAFIVNDAAMTAAFTRNPISDALMQMSIKNTPPSLQKEVIEEYTQIRNKMNGIARRAIVQSL
ncbi:MAG: AAA family ATPase [Paludibacteraceae bacterium]|nr:AAA family ATPase [Paludibacteraceae bacterium]